ncbi:MAG TPA: ParB/RepB/Spo0J family partition protein [Allosphingosinicella sp.]|jgi:ParB family chromosome partitioning protein
MNSSTAALAKLYISDLNVRRTDRALDIDALADDIAAHGLIEPLVVVDEGKGRGRFGVIAGGRRLLALQLLDKTARWRSTAGKVDPSAIPIQVREVEEGREISLSENVHKVAMNPADEVEAYAAIVADYEARGERDPAVRLARCARHYGKTVHYVEQRLRLAGLVPEALEALRAGRITLDSAKAYASVGDQEVQRQIFAAQEREGKHSVAGIRSAVAGRIYRATDRQVRYVGVEAYVAAGGRLDRDLFMGAEDGEVILDTGLLDRLATQKGEGEALRVAAAAGYGGAVLKAWGGGAWQWPKTPEGLQRVYSLAGLGPDERASAFVICAIAADGASVELTDEGFKLAAAPAADAGAPPTRRPGSFLPLKDGESEVERLARIRRRKIEAAAVRLAVPAFEGTALEGRTHWPTEGQTSIPALQEDDEFYAVAVYVKVSKAEVGRRMAEAEAIVDQEFGGPPPRPPRIDDSKDWPEEAPARELAETMS